MVRAGRVLHLMAACALILAALSIFATPVGARDQPCFWQDFREYTDLDDVNFLGALGCRLNDSGRWVEGRILADDQSLVEVPRGYRSDIADFIDAVHDEIDKMLADREIERLYAYDLDTGELIPGPDFYRNPRDDRGPIDMVGQPLSGTTEGPTGGSYEDAAIEYLSLPGRDGLEGYVSWYMTWRDDAVQSAVENNFDPIAEQAYLNRAHFGTIPTPWQLADRERDYGVRLVAYRRVRNGLGHTIGGLYPSGRTAQCPIRIQRSSPSGKVSSASPRK